jgi:hypothetical protein
MNKQIVDVTFRCDTCDTRTTMMCHSDNLGTMMLLCYNCHYARLANERKVTK